MQAWLNEYVSLPAGYRTTRRDALKFVSLGAALTSGYVSLTRAKVGAALLICLQFIFSSFSLKMYW